jgi:HAD superfamily hydrolase (TIGR01484 family)
MKSLIIFDLDGTLAPSKSPMEAETTRLFAALLEHCRVAVMSGGAWPQFEKQLLTSLPAGARLDQLSLLPTSGTRFLAYDNGDWKQLYAEDFPPDERRKIIETLQTVFEASGFASEQHWGDRIEDRGSQITLSALGQAAPLEVKAKWDPDFQKRRALKAKLEPLLPECAIGMGGASSLDITRPGVDKAYGVQKLKEVLKIDIADMMFVGDALFEGGNDYPARRTGVDCIQVAGPSETRKVIETLLACLPRQA